MKIESMNNKKGGKKEMKEKKERKEKKIKVITYPIRNCTPSDF